jgi:guanylate kinase
MEKKDFIAWVKKLQPNYRPNDAVLAKLAHIDLVALVGPTGVGKTTIISKLELPYVPSDVTRPAREGEKNGHEYFFRNDYFQILDDIKAGNYVQFLVSGSGEFYGTRAESYPEQGTASMAIIASAIPHFRELGFRKVIPIYILPPSYTEWMHRIGTGRVTDLDARMKEAAESLPIALADAQYHFVLNDDLNMALSEIKTIIAGGKVSEHRDSLARSSADLLFGRLGIADDLLL